MLLSVAAPPKTFNLLSIGQRGVGKTVYLAGSYAELQSQIQASHPEPREFWFDCQDTQVQQNMELLLDYVAQSGQYPPATMKITNFNFSLKRQNLWSEKTLCHFRWWDVPGEVCNIQTNRDFQKMVLTSHGCCVFINASALLHDQAYVQSLENVIKQVMGIASLVHQRGLQYPLAIIFTKCDLLQLGPISQLQIEQSLQPLISVLDAVKANYKRFYSAIPIVAEKNTATLKAKGAAAGILWLASELSTIHTSHRQQDLGSGLMQTSSELLHKPSLVKNAPRPKLAAIIYKYVLPLMLASISIIGVSFALFLSFRPHTFNLEQAFRKQLKVLPLTVERP